MMTQLGPSRLVKDEHVTAWGWEGAGRESAYAAVAWSPNRTCVGGADYSIALPLDIHLSRNISCETLASS